MLQVLNSPYRNSHRALDDAFGVTSIVDAALPMLEETERPRLTILALEDYITDHLPCWRTDVTNAFPELTGITISATARRMETEKRLKIERVGRLVHYVPYASE